MKTPPDHPAAPTVDRRKAEFTEALGPEISPMYHRLRRLGVRDGDLDDVAHDVLVQVWLHWDEYDPQRPLRPWVVAFSVRIASNYRQRAANRLPHVPLDDREADPAEAPDHALSKSEERATLLLALDALPDEQREMVVLVNLEDCAVTEAAALLSVPLNTAYTRLRLGRAALEREVRRLLNEGRGR